MMSFKEFMAAQPAQAQPAAPATASKTKWKATKEQIVSYWKNLRPDTPIQMKPIDYTHKGSTYGEDGLRLTGSPQFIASVLARLKELLNFETPANKLAVTYRQTESPSKVAMGQSKTSYVFYVAARQRGGGDKDKIIPT
jgi:hypothetical protein